MKRFFWHHFKERQQRHDAWYLLCPMYEPVLNFCFWSANQCSGLGKLDAIWPSNQVYLSNLLLHLDREQTLISYSEYIDSTYYRVEPKVIHGHDSIYFYHNYHPCYFCYYSRRSFLAEERPLILMLVSHWYFVVSGRALTTPLQSVSDNSRFPFAWTFIQISLCCRDVKASWCFYWPLYFLLVTSGQHAVSTCEVNGALHFVSEPTKTNILHLQTA